MSFSDVRREFIGATWVALAVSVALPLTHSGSVVWGLVVAAMGIACLGRARLPWGRVAGDVVLALALMAFLRVVAQSYYESGARLGTVARAASLLLGASWRSWVLHGSVVVDGVDGTLAVACDAAKLALWEFLGLLGVSLWVLHRNGRLRVSAVAVLAVLWATALLIRFSILVAWYASTSSVLVPATTSPLRVFWATEFTVPYLCALSLPIAWAAFPTWRRP